MKSVSEDIHSLLSRGVSEFVDPDGVFVKKLEAKAAGTYTKDIVIKLGADPNRPDIHIGHAVVLRAMRKFQDLGCKVIFLVGDFTAQIGDPTGKSKVRPEIDQEQVETNMRTYIEQVGKILRTDPWVFSWIRNSDWFYSPSDIAADPAATVTLPTNDGRELRVPANSFLGKATIFENSRMQKTHLHAARVQDITLRGLLWTLRHITHSRLIERDMFRERLARNEELYMHEMLYPVLQGIDSYVLAGIYGSCDLEMGGSDQTFNMLMGRDVMKANGIEPQAVLAMRLLTGTDGKEKMSKSLDNYIGITDTPNEMFGKVMSIPDTSIPEYFELATYTPADELEAIAKELKKGARNPKELKVRLAKEIIAIYHGDAAAEAAEKNFEKTFAKGGMPDDAPVVVAAKGELLAEVLIKAGIVPSKSEFRRLLSAGAISVVGKDALTDEKFPIEGPIDIRVGKHRFVKISL